MYNPREKARPASRILEALEGKISEPKKAISHKPGSEGREVTVRLVEEGTGFVSLKERGENKEWSGMFNHLTKTARVAVYLAEELKKRGENVIPDLILNTILVSHVGRRQWDEARWYPDAVDQAQEKIDLGDFQLALSILGSAGLSQEVMEGVDAHGAGINYPFEKMDTWEKKLALYADHRVAQNVTSLRERFDALAQSVSGGRFTQEQLDAIKAFDYQIEEEIFSKLSIKPEDITDDFPPQPRWEQYIRRCYINDAERGIFSRLSELYTALYEHVITHGEIDQTIIDTLSKEFPEDTWWGSFVRALYKARKGIPLHPQAGKQIGMARAIQFYKLREAGQRRSS